MSASAENAKLTGAKNNFADLNVEIKGSQNQRFYSTKFVWSSNQVSYTLAINSDGVFNEITIAILRHCWLNENVLS